MHCTCVRQADLPHATALFLDVLYDPDRTTPFYRHPYRTLADFQAAAGEIDFPEDRRAALVAALRVQNPESASLQLLSRPGTVAVVTGQQVGLFSGPAYTLYKALHAAKLAAWLSENGTPAVPLFWLATEDHDFAEVNHAWVFDGDHRPHKLEMVRAASSQPVGEVTLATPPVAQLKEILATMPFGAEVSALVEETYTQGRTMGAAFGDLLRRMVAELDILQVDPMLPAFRQLAAPALSRAVEAAPELGRGLLERNRELSDRGYHAQVHIEEQTSLFFLLENGKRLALRRQGGEYILNGRRFTTGELSARSASLSPNALLRPVVQDSMIPSVAYIGGPAETAYLAQSEVLYAELLGRMPVAVPRTGFTILDARSAKLMDRYGMGLKNFFFSDDVVRGEIAAKLVPPHLTNTIEQTASTVDAAVGRLKSELTSFDPTLARALENSSRKISYQLQKIRGKTEREALRRDVRATRDAASLSGLIYPERHLQERLYSILPLLAKHGLELVGQLYASIELDCSDHRLLVL